MILGDKISTLRRTHNMSQEELAEQMDVSRQSVSKWESGTSVPDMNKILKLSEIFGVTTDYLLKDEIEEDRSIVIDSSSNNNARNVSAEDANGYMDAVRNVAGRMTFGIALCIISPTVLMGLMGYSELKGGAYEEIFGGIGVACLLVLVAIGVMLIVGSSMKISKWDYMQKEELILDYGVKGIVERRREEFENVFRKNMTTGIALCIIAAVPLIVAGAMGVEDCIVLVEVALLLVCVAIGVYKIVWAAVIEETHRALLQLDEFESREKVITAKLGWMPGAYWMVTLGIYLAISFITSCWDRSWIVWPVAGVLYVAVKHIARGVVGRKL